MRICRNSLQNPSFAENGIKHIFLMEQYGISSMKMREICCANSYKMLPCGSCEMCQLVIKIKEANEWIPRLGDFSRKALMLGLVRRMDSVDLVKKFATLLHPVIMKDSIYARSRSNPSLTTDVMSVSGDRALNNIFVPYVITLIWEWFSQLSSWSKAKFLLHLLQDCDIHLLYLLYLQLCSLLISNLNFIKSMQGTSMHEMCRTTVLHSVHSKETKDSELLSSNSVEEHSIDPAVLILTMSSKAYSGVSQYKDFIGCLPVHLALFILNLLDQTSLYNALCVNDKWRTLAEEIRIENRVKQDLREEAMLMQGAATQGSHPNYANDIDVLVPELRPGSWEVKQTSESTITTTFKSEICFKTAYTGVATYKVIMEERNIFCSPYNVMVVCDIQDIHRVCHNDGGSLIAIGSKDRKVRFIDSISGKSRGPVITGHAGSIRCVHICQSRGIVFSGSYDTSIRCWSTESGRCLKTYRGHTDTILTIAVHASFLISGSKDKTCRVWDISSRKCRHIFRHRYSVTAIAFSSEICISGCAGGGVKVWDFSNGQLIKNLTGHHGPITAIKFDSWHIVTGSQDGYALAWSALGRHNRCLIALRHPNEVLCLEFMYLKVITGSGDGRLRIWNMVNGQCLRIMRGNSRSDPIRSIIAKGDQITVNTLSNLLVINFEHVVWDYTMDSSKISSQIHYASYSDAPVRSQRYSYVRAQRMRKAGASNKKILKRDSSLHHTVESGVKFQYGYHAPQLPHSAKWLSSKKLEQVKQIQSITRPVSRKMSHKDRTRSSDNKTHLLIEPRRAVSALSDRRRKETPLSYEIKQETKMTPSRSTPVVKIAVNDTNCNNHKKYPIIKHRMSWSFEKPLEPPNSNTTLSDIKALLRSQIHMKAEKIIPPDFVHLTVDAIQNGMVPLKKNNNMLQVEGHVTRTRPFSSPNRLDSSAKVPIEELGLNVCMDDEGTISELSDLDSIQTIKVRSPSTQLSIMSKDIDYVTRRLTSLKGKITRPISAGLLEQQQKDVKITSNAPRNNLRPVTAPFEKIEKNHYYSPETHDTSTWSPSHRTSKHKSHQLTSAAVEFSVVSMVYSKEVKNKINEIKKNHMSRDQSTEFSRNKQLMGKMNLHNIPIHTNTKLCLMTHEQEEDLIRNIEDVHKEKRKRKNTWSLAT